MAQSSSFTVPISFLADQAKNDVEIIARKMIVELFSRVIQKSPVGNPELWKANRGAVYARETHNLFAVAAGKKRKSGKSLQKLYPLPVTGRARKGGTRYVGGRFKANWNVSIAAPNYFQRDEVDPSGSAVTARMISRVGDLPLGGVMYLSNGLPYALRLENGWSRQAPLGMIRTTLAEFAAGGIKVSI